MSEWKRMKMNVGGDLWHALVYSPDAGDSQARSQEHQKFFHVGDRDPATVTQDAPEQEAGLEVDQPGLKRQTLAKGHRYFQAEV